MADKWQSRTEAQAFLVCAFNILSDASLSFNIGEQEFLQFQCELESSSISNLGTLATMNLRLICQKHPVAFYLGLFLLAN